MKRLCCSNAVRWESLAAVSCNYVERGVYRALYVNDCLFSLVVTSSYFVTTFVLLVLRNFIVVKLNLCFFMLFLNLVEFKQTILSCSKVFDFGRPKQFKSLDQFNFMHLLQCRISIINAVQYYII